MMEAKYANTEFGEYAQMRKGYVQMQAGKHVDAKKTYLRFLEDSPGSKYSRLVQHQMGELDRLDQLAKANGKNRRD